MQTIEKIEALKNRTRQFALNIIQLCQAMPKTEASMIMRKQLLRSATSVGANYRAACRARSKAELFHKLCIVMEEVDETDYWLDLIKNSGTYNQPPIDSLISETLELVKIFSTLKHQFKPKK